MNKKVSELVEVVNVVDDALFYVVDTADLSEDIAGTSKKIKKSSLIKKSTILHSGTVKTDITEADPIVYTKTTVDSLLTSKADLVSGKVPSSQLPSYVDDVIEVANFGALPLTGESGKIYVTIDNNKLFRWSGTVYIEISAGVSDHTLLTNIGTNSHAQIDTALTRLANTSGTNTGDQDLSGLATNTNLNLKADQDGTILYHSVKWFTPTGTVSNVGATVTSVGTQFLNTMVGAKLTINGESRIITGFTSSTVVTVNSAYSVNNTGVVAGNWGVYSKAFETGTGVNKNIMYSYAGSLISYINTNNQAYAPNFASPLFSTQSSETSLENTGINLGANRDIKWSNGTGSNSIYLTKDLGLRRNTAGVLEIYDGVTATGLLANRRDLLVRNITASAGVNSDHVVIKSQLVLEAVNEGNGIGYVINGRNPANYGNVGLSAVDLSSNASASSTKGATGAYTFAVGGANRASGQFGAVFGGNNENLGDYSVVGGGSHFSYDNYQAIFGLGNIGRSRYETVVGTFSEDYTPSGTATDRLFVIGNGTGFFSRANAVTVLRNGNVGIGTVTPTSKLQVVGLPSYADNASAITGGLTVGAFYHTNGTLKVVI